MTEKIDAYTHFVLPETLDWFERGTGREFPRRAFHTRRASMCQAAARIELMDALGVDRHVLVPIPDIFVLDEIASSPALAAEGARTANMAMAANVSDHPSRFSGVAFLPTVRGADLVAELEHAVGELGLAGGVVFVGPNSLALDSPELHELYDAATELNVPLWVHPTRTPDDRDVVGESESKFRFYAMFGFVTDDTLAASRIVFSGAFTRNPGLKVILHHCGGMIPFFHGRIAATMASFGGFDQGTPDDFRRFYVDTALMEHAPRALGVVVDHFGTDHVLFGSDAPLGSDDRRYSLTADSTVGAVEVAPEVREQIYAGNVRRLLKLEEGDERRKAATGGDFDEA